MRLSILNMHQLKEKLLEVQIGRPLKGTSEVIVEVLQRIPNHALSLKGTTAQKIY
jgi:hypothetical protein